MKKRFVSLILVFVILLGVTSTAMGQRPVKILIDGKEVKSDVPPYIENGRTMVPVRFVTEALESKVNYDREKYYKNPSVTISSDLTDRSELVLFIDRNIAFSGEKAYKLDCPAVLKNDRTFVPLRFIIDYLGASIDWDEKNNTVIIKSGDGSREALGNYEDKVSSGNLNNWIKNKNEENFNKAIGKEEKNLETKILDVIYGSDNEVLRGLKKGLTVLFMPNTVKINGKKAHVIKLGDNFETHFATHDYYAIDIENGKIYKSDFLTDKWNLVK